MKDAFYELIGFLGFIGISLLFVFIVITLFQITFNKESREELLIYITVFLKKTAKSFFVFLLNITSKLNEETDIRN